MPHCPIRFGSFPWPSENHCTSLSACHSIVDLSFPIKNLEVNQEVTIRDFDPMLLEAQAYGVSREPCSAARDFDPMLLESVTDGPLPGRHKSTVPPGTEALLNSSSVLLGATATSLTEHEATFLPSVAVANDASSGRLSSVNAVLETGCPCAGSAKVAAKEAVQAAGPGFLHQAQRATGNEISPSRHKAGNPSAKCYDEEDGDNVGVPTAGRFFFPAVYGYILLHSDNLSL